MKIKIWSSINEFNILLCGIMEIIDFMDEHQLPIALAVGVVVIPTALAHGRALQAAREKTQDKQDRLEG